MTDSKITDERLREAVSHIKTWVMCEAWAVDTIEAALAELVAHRIEVAEWRNKWAYHMSATPPYKLPTPPKEADDDE